MQWGWKGWKIRRGMGANLSSFLFFRRHRTKTCHRAGRNDISIGGRHLRVARCDFSSRVLGYDVSERVYPVSSCTSCSKLFRKGHFFVATFTRPNHHHTSNLISFRRLSGKWKVLGHIGGIVMVYYAVSVDALLTHQILLGEWLGERIRPAVCKSLEDKLRSRARRRSEKEEKVRNCEEREDEIVTALAVHPPSPNSSSSFRFLFPSSGWYAKSHRNQRCRNAWVSWARIKTVCLPEMWEGKGGRCLNSHSYWEWMRGTIHV